MLVKNHRTLLQQQITCQLSMRRAYPPIGTCLTSLTQVMKWRHNFLYKSAQLLRGLVKRAPGVFQAPLPSRLVESVLCSSA